MKIMVTIGSLRFSGAERVLLALSNNLKKRGNEIIFIAMEDDKRSPYKDPLDNNIDIHLVEYQGNFFIKNIKRIFSIHKLIKDCKPDVIISFGYILNPIIILSSLFTRIPVIISERNDPKVEPNRNLYRILRRVLYPFSNKLIVQTEEIADFFHPFMKEKISIIPNPITNNKIPHNYTGKRKKNIVSVGRLDQMQKNQLLLIKSFSMLYKEFPDYKLIIYGEGEDRKILEKEIIKLGLEDNIKLPGQKDNIMELIKDASMFVLSSEFEGMPNALIEAMAMGLPCISTDCGGGGAKTLINSYENGILVNRDDSIQLANAMKYIIEHPEKSFIMSNNALKIRDEYSLNNIVDKWELVLTNRIN